MRDACQILQSFPHKQELSDHQHVFSVTGGRGGRGGKVQGGEYR